MSEVANAVNELIDAMYADGKPDIAKKLKVLMAAREDEFNSIFSQLRELKMIVDSNINHEQLVLDKFMGAFPAGDARAHKEAHMAWMAREQKSSERWEAIISKSLAGLVWLVLTGLALSVWSYIKDGING